MFLVYEESFCTETASEFLRKVGDMDNATASKTCGGANVWITK